MPSESSLYRKIQVALDIAKSVKVDSVVGLRAEISGRKPPNFLSRRYDRETDKFVVDISGRSIRQTVAICRILGLLEESGGLSEQGRRAIQRAKFDNVLASRIRALMRGEDVDLPALNTAIEKGFHAKPPTLPTAKELWGASHGSMTYPLFARMLTLLSHSGGAKSTQKKIYLHIAVH